MTEVHFVVQEKYFNAIKSGSKVVEGRVNKPKYERLHVGQTVTFQNANGDEKFQAKVTFLHRYSTFKEYLEEETLERCLPGVECVEEGISIYHGFPGYEEDAKLLGVLGIGIELIM